MSKSLASAWLRGLNRLVSIQAGYTGSTPAVETPAAVGSGPASSPASEEAGPVSAGASGHARHASRVGPRAGAWVRGTWTKAFFSAPPAPGDLVNHLAYGLYLPAGKAAAHLPLVVMLHGCKQNVEAFAQGTRMNLLADQYGFAVLYPEQSNHAHPHRCWRWYNSSPEAGGAEAVAIAALVRATLAEHDLDASRVYVAGLSAGAGMATLLAVRYPDLFAALGVHSGMVLGAAQSAVGGMDVMRRGTLADPLALAEAEVDMSRYPGMPALLLHGAQDNVVAPVNLEQLEQQFVHLNRLSDTNGPLKGITVKEALSPTGEFQRNYSRRGRRIVQVCRVPDLAHAWSGGDDALPFHSAKGPQASALFWEFFKHQRLAPRDEASLGLDASPSSIGAF
jgi:poly(hydroxyalkanoate) depolymerase family esterase